jgi:hypothetical protein
MASRFTDGAWSSPVALNGTDSVDAFFDAPAIVFDGTTFVAAWTALNKGRYVAFTARFDPERGEWQAPEQHVYDVAKRTMPRLGVDSRQNLILVWAVISDSISIVYRRYEAATKEWGEIRPIPGATIDDSQFEESGRLPFAMSASGVGAMLLVSRVGDVTTARLMSFE